MPGRSPDICLKTHHMGVKMLSCLLGTVQASFRPLGFLAWTLLFFPIALLLYDRGLRFIDSETVLYRSSKTRPNFYVYFT